MSRYGLRSRLTGAANANTINYWFGGGFANLPKLVDYLVVAGGGGGGGCAGSSLAAGGGGAGGYRTSTGFTIILSTNYTVTVGAGGTNGTGTTRGTNSSSIKNNCCW